MLRTGVIGGLFARTLLWLVPALGLWYWAREAVVAPVAWLARVAMLDFFPGWVLGARLDGTTAVLLTLLQVPAGGGALRDFTPEVAVLPYCYGLPLLAALLLASRARGLWSRPPRRVVFDVAGVARARAVVQGLLQELPQLRWRRARAGCGDGTPLPRGGESWRRARAGCGGSCRWGRWCCGRCWRGGCASTGWWRSRCMRPR